MTLIISKKHFDSYVFDMPEKEYVNKYCYSGFRMSKIESSIFSAN